MIVKCDQCQSRFKIADEKVTEKGVKVRCTKCQHTFRVKREVAAAAPAPLSDPFAAFSQPPSTTSSAVFDQPTRIAVIPKELLISAGRASEPSLPPSPSFPPPLPEPGSTTPAPSFGLEGAVEGQGPEAGSRGVADLFGDLPPPEGDPSPPAATDPFAFPAPAPEPGGTVQEAASGVPEPAPAPPEPGPEPAAGPAPAAVAIGRLRSKTSSPKPLPGGAGRRVGALVLNIALAVGLLVVLVTVGSVYLNDGNFELAAFSPDRLRASLAPSSELVLRDLSNGLYETKAGRPVFFIRGEVVNRGNRSERVRLRGEILDGDQLVRAADAFAGATPTPEDLYHVTSATDLATLMARLEKRAMVVKPGERAPFVVPFSEYPPDLSEFRLKVSVVTGAPKETASR